MGSGSSGGWCLSACLCSVHAPTHDPKSSTTWLVNSAWIPGRRRQFVLPVSRSDREVGRRCGAGLSLSGSDGDPSQTDCQRAYDASSDFWPGHSHPGNCLDHDMKVSALRLFSRQTKMDNHCTIWNK